MKAAAILTLAALLSACQADGQMNDSERAEIEKAVLETHSEIEKAAQTLDLEKLYAFVLENDKGSQVQDGRIILTRKDALDSTKQGMQGLKSVDYDLEQQHVTVLSSTAALLVADGTTTAVTDKGRSFSVRFAQSVLFVLRDGEWKVLHAHRSFPPRR